MNTRPSEHRALITLEPGNIGMTNYPLITLKLQVMICTKLKAPPNLCCKHLCIKSGILIADRIHHAFRKEKVALLYFLRRFNI